jgi:hypothetical protein
MSSFGCGFGVFCFGLWRRCVNHLWGKQGVPCAACSIPALRGASGVPQAGHTGCRLGWRSEQLQV